MNERPHPRFEQMLRDSVIQEAETERRIKAVKDRIKADPRLARDHTWHSEKELESFLDVYAMRVLGIAEPMWPGIPKISAMLPSVTAEWNEDQEENYRQRLLWPILQKKAFDLQCRWVAGQAELPAYITSVHFAYWEHFPDIIGAMGHITDRDFDTYLQFRATEPLRQAQFTKDLIMQGEAALKHHHAHRSLYLADPDRSLPEWFHFHDAEFGTDHLRHLPNTRADLEQDHLDIYTEHVLMPTLDPYRQAVLRHRHRATRQRMATDPDYAAKVLSREKEAIDRASPIGKEYLTYQPGSTEFMKRLMGAVCTLEEMDRFERLLVLSGRRMAVEYLQYITRFMNSLSPPGPIDAHPDLYVALGQMYDSKRYGRDSELLVPRYEEYLDARFAQPATVAPAPSLPELDERTGRILAARRHLGMPENLRFLHQTR